MRLAYISFDEVHRDLAECIARERNDTVVMFVPGAEPGEGFDAVLHDLDYLSPAVRRQLLARLHASSSSRPVPVGVHTYDPDDEVSALAARGVVVARRLGPDLFRSLAGSRLDAPSSPASQRWFLPWRILISTRGLTFRAGLLGAGADRVPQSSEQNVR